MHVEYIHDCRHRRQHLFSLLSVNDIVIACTAPQQVRNGDVFFAHRPDSDFFYLTAFPEPMAVVVLLPDGKGDGQVILFNQVKDPTQTIWNGPVTSQATAVSKFQMDVAWPIFTLGEKLPSYCCGRQNVYLSLAHHPILEATIRPVLEQQRQSVPNWTEHALAALLHPMRLRKSLIEIDCMRRAVSITAKAHVAVMQQCRPTLREADMAGILWQAMVAGGASYCAYPHIVAAGSNACVLHHQTLDATLCDGQMLLVDAGAEWRGYAADITRTVPINGRFTKVQQAVYEWVLAAQNAVIEAIRPGVRWCDLQAICVQVLSEALIDLGVCDGSVDTVVESQAYKAFFMHGFGHWLGLDVHDVGDYGRNRSVMLEPGMVLTVEPGLYFSPHQASVPAALRGMGVRIEDNILVTTDGCENLSIEIPKKPAEVMSLMSQAA